MGKFFILRAVVSLFVRVVGGWKLTLACILSPARGGKWLPEHSFNFHSQRQLFDISVVYYLPRDAIRVSGVDVEAAELHGRRYMLSSEVDVR